jgi:hypothetical protein
MDIKYHDIQGSVMTEAQKEGGIHCAQFIAGQDSHSKMKVS